MSSSGDALGLCDGALQGCEEEAVLGGVDLFISTWEALSALPDMFEGSSIWGLIYAQR